MTDTCPLSLHRHRGYTGFKDYPNQSPRKFHGTTPLRRPLRMGYLGHKADFDETGMFVGQNAKWSVE